MRRRAAARAGKKGKPGELLKAPVKPTARVKTVLRPPIWTGHADFTNPFEFATFMRMAEGLVFDVMMEGKSKDLSLLRLRPDLLRFAPDVAARFGITADELAKLNRQAWIDGLIPASIDAYGTPGDVRFIATWRPNTERVGWNLAAASTPSDLATRQAIFNAVTGNRLR